jgi:hypothetical protein
MWLPHESSPPGETSLRVVPDASLSPFVSAPQQARRTLQERVATGWRAWSRHSNTAQIVLPQQIGLDFTVRQRSSGLEYLDRALLRPQFASGEPPKPPVPVRMGPHAFDGSYSEVAFVPFPFGSPSAPPAASLNVTLVCATAPASNASAGHADDRVCVLSTNASTAAAATAANLSVVFRPAAYWGAHASFALVGSGAIAIDAGELGQLTATFSQPPLQAAGAGASEVELEVQPIDRTRDHTSHHTTRDHGQCARCDEPL